MAIDPGLRNLSPRQRVAVHQALEFILRSFEPLGVVLCGSPVRGEGDEVSDLDLYVVGARDERHRIQKRFRGVSAEILVNPPGRIRECLRDETGEGAPSTADVLARGVVVHGRGDAVVEALLEEARAVLRTGPRPTEAQLARGRDAAGAREAAVERIREMAGEDDVEWLDVPPRTVHYMETRLHARAVLRIGTDFVVETTEHPGEWWLGARDGGDIVVWGSYGSLEEAVRGR